MQSPHDKIFKKILGKHENAADFLKNHLPSDILAKVDLGSLQIEKDTFVDEALKESYSDLVYSVQVISDDGKKMDAFIYLLMEHKSSPDPYTALQLLRYMTSVWKQFTDNNSGKLLPFILPLVLYHGEAGWQFGSDFQTILEIPEKSFQKYAINYEYILWDLSATPDEDIKGKILTEVFLLTLKYVRNSDSHKKLPEILNLLASLYQSDKSGLEDLRSLLIYILNASDKVDGREMLKYIDSNPVVKEKIMPTAAEIISEKARKEGEMKGKLEGMLEGKLEDARNLLELNVPLETVLKATGLSMDELKKAELVEQ